MGSFRVKLVAYFLLLSLLPLTAAFWGYAEVAARSATRLVDARMEAGLRASMAAYDDELESARALRALAPARLAPGHGKVVESPLEAMDRAIARGP